MINIKEKNLGGRPRVVLNKKEIEEVEILAQYLNMEQIADHLGIDEKTFFNIRQRQLEVFTAYKKGRSKAIGFVAAKLMEKIRNGDTTATIFFLKTQAGWSEKQRLDLTTNVPASLPQILLKSNTKKKDAVGD